MINLMKAERVSVLSTPTAMILLAASVVMAPISMTANLSAIDDLAAEADSALRLAMHASTVATLVFSLVAGVYAATSDLRHGLVDQMLLSQPKRGQVLAAKTAVSGMVGGIYGLLGGAVALAVGTAYYASRDASFDLGSPVVWRSLSGLMMAAPLFAVIGVGLGSIVKSQPAAMSGALVWMLVVEPAAILGLPDVARFFPGAAGLALTYSPDDALLSQVSAATLLGFYATLAAAGATHRFAADDVS